MATVPDSQKQYGGWYDNPQTGKNQRWWGSGVWTDGAEPTQQTPQEDPVTSLIKTSIDAYSKKYDEYVSKYNEFEQKNPFNFDQILEEEKSKVKQRLDPYYEQTLTDYLTGVNTKRKRSIEDERTLLTQVQQDTNTFQDRQKQQVQDTIDQVREGKADAGLYDSGSRLRDEGKATVQADKNLTDYLTNQDRRVNDIKTTTQRLSEDLALDERMKRRDLTTDQTYQVNAQALPEVQRRQQQREFERGQYTGAPAGVDPNTYSTSLYSFLR